MKKNVFYIFVLALVALILARADSVIFYTKQTLIMCYEIIIPSLFPFFVCSGMLIYSGFASVTAKYAQSIMRPLFNVAPTGSAAFVLGIISGFPLGAVCTKDLYKCGNLSKSEAERLLAFCNNSGPLFIIGSIGTAIYLKPIYGAMLYVIHIISSIIVGVIFRSYNKNCHISPPTRINTNEISIPQAISKSLDSAAKNIITVCFSVLFFSVLSQTVLELLPLSSIINAIVSGLCEFSTGVLKVSVLDTDIFYKLIMTSFIVGFSGISVHLQVMSVTAEAGLSLKPYILGKALHGIIAAVFTAVVLLITEARPAFSQASQPMSLSFFVSAVFLSIGIIAVVFLISIFSKKLFSHI